MLVDGKLDFLMTKKNISNLLETEEADKISFNHAMFVFKSKDLTFFGGNLTQRDTQLTTRKYKPWQKCKSPQNFQDLQSHLGLVNYLNHFSPWLAELTVLLRAFSKRDTVDLGKAYSKQYLKQSRRGSLWHPS